jgi:acyl-CoA synthetase (AMP-forming)/AMP-acid ligase II
VSGWNVADVWDEIARLRPERQAVVRGSDVRSWARFEQGAALVAAGLREAGLRRQAKVAIYLHNSIEYLEVLYGAFKGSFVPVNTNYRYVDRELVTLWQAADVEAVVFHGAFSTTVDALRSEVPDVRLWWWVDDGSGPCPAWARPFDTRPGAARPAAPDTDDVRSGDDLLLLYTGGTTGLPRGVMWRQDDLFVVLNRIASLRYPEEPDLTAVEAVVGAVDRARTRVLPAAPLMHGTAMFTALGALDAGGTVVLSSGGRFDPIELLDTVERERVSLVSLVGDAFARPVVDQLEAHPGRWDLTSLQVIVSSGVMWSQPVRDALLAHVPGLACVDTFGSSEAIGVARSISSEGRSSPTGGFELGPGAQVLGEDGQPVVPGSGEVGLVASSGRGPIGYYHDSEATARAFRVIDGVRWITPGDRAVVDADGSVRLLGRGSGCINTGGEKVFPEEVEEALKLEPDVRDAVVVGVPDERFGEIVVGIVEPTLGQDLSTAELRQIQLRLERSLAGYKVPRRWLVVDTIGRAPNGKVDQRRWRSEALRGARGH